MTDRPQTISIAADDRARIPFAMIGVIILLSSTAVIGVLETRPQDPRDDSNVDVSMALDQAVSSSQTVLKSSVREATKAAAEEPLLRAAGTPAGNAINDSIRTGQLNTSEIRYRTFRRYVRLRIYLKAQDKLGSVRHERQDNLTTKVSLPKVENTEGSLEDAIDRVHLTVGKQDDTLEPGKLKAEIEGLDIGVYRQGELEERTTRDVTVTVATTAFDLHNRTQRYERNLNMGFFDRRAGVYRGLGRKMAARYYLLAYSKAYLQSLTSASFKKILTKKDATFLTNQAIYQVQNSVFGKHDRYADRYMKGAWLCFISRQSTSLITSYTSKTSQIRSMQNSLCRATKYVFGDVDGATPSGLLNSPPWNIVKQGNVGLGGLRGLFNGQGPSQQSVELSVDKYATAALAESNPQRAAAQWIDDTDNIHEDNSLPRNYQDNEDEYSLDDSPSDLIDNGGQVQPAIDEIYRVDLDSQVQNVWTTQRNLPDNDNPPENNGDWSETGDSSYEVRSSTVEVVDYSEPWQGQSGRDRTFHEFEVKVRNTLKERQKWVNYSADPDDEDWTTSQDTGTVEYHATITVGGSHSAGLPSGTGINRGISDGQEYERGGSHPNLGYTPDNFRRAPGESLRELFSVDPGNAESGFESYVRGEVNANDIVYESDFDSDLQSVEQNGLLVASDLFDGDQNTLRTWLREHVLPNAHQYTVNHVDPVSTDTMAMATGNPHQDLLRNLADHKTEIIYGPSGPDSHRTAADKARIRVRQLYYQRIREMIREVSQKKEDAKGKINDKLGNKMSGVPNLPTDVIGESLGFVQRLFNSNTMQRRSGNFAGSPLLDDVSYEVKGSPTYLPSKTVSRLTVPSVRPAGTPADIPRDAMHAPLSVKRNDMFGYPGLPIVPWPAFWLLSVDNWVMESKGEYARFEVKATRGDAPGSPTTRYVRQDQRIELLIDGRERYVGDVRPINFESMTSVFVAVPGGSVPVPGVPAVGDKLWRVKGETCSKTWPQYGPGVQQPTGSLSRNCQPGSGVNFQRFLPDTSPSVSCAAGVIDAATSARIARPGVVGELGRPPAATSSIPDECGEEMEVHFIDVGQGRSILIEAPKPESEVEEDGDEEEEILIDAGTTAPSTNEETVLRYLAEEGVDDIEHLVLTHNHQDHLSLVDTLLNVPEGSNEDGNDRFVDRIHYSGVEHPANPGFESDIVAARSGVSGFDDFDELRAGDGSVLGEDNRADFTVLNPPSGSDRSCSQPPDCNAIVLKFEYGGKSFLLPSDIREPQEDDIEDQYNVEADVLQLSHHGSNEANGEAFIKAVEPTTVVTSSKKLSGFPHEDTIERLQRLDGQFGIDIQNAYWTGIHDDIVFEVTACSCMQGDSVITSRNADATLDHVHDEITSRGDDEYETPSDIRGVGTELGNRLSDEIGSMSDIRDADVAELKQVDGIGDKLAESIHHQLEEPDDSDPAEHEETG
ncbi:DUF7286 family protein [Halorientalis pallida]|uniref:DUF7286 family protein n=1 Tax=Halorientalis pallida TaxID=2479928 RepID=UPI003C7016B2